MKTDKYDVVVIGAGPAGSSTAIRLATSGFKVMLAEKARFPRQKLCGEFVSPECLDHFDELGVAPDIKRFSVPNLKKTVFYSCAGRNLAVANHWLGEKAFTSIGLSRSVMDDLLLTRARHLGVEVCCETSLVRPVVTSGRLSAVELRAQTGEKFKIETRIAIDATGRGRTLSRLFDLAKPPKATLVAFKAHLRNAAIEKGSCEIFSYPGGYGGCSEIEDGLFNLCFIANASSIKKIGNDPMRALRDLVMKNPRANEVFSQVEFVDDWLAVPIVKFGRQRLDPKPGIFAVGDAAAFIDPFTGSGIAMALESARLATQAITSNRNVSAIAVDYRRLYAAAFDRRLKFCRILRLVSTAPGFADAVIAVLARSSYLTKRFAEATRSGTMNISARNL